MPSIENTGALAQAGQRLVVVVAHPDDETFGCGTLIAAATDAGAYVTVVCATRGEAGERVPDAATDHVPLAELRELELRQAAGVLGVHEVVVLAHADSGFDGPYPHGALCGVAVDLLATEIAGLLLLADPDTVLILDGSDGHRDHLHLRQAVERALVGHPSGTRLARSCLSNSLMRQWVAEMQSVNPDTVYLEADIAMLGAPDDTLTAIDGSAWLDRRERAIACHRSQRSPYDGLSPELRRAFLTTDFVAF
jgi:LmbE family N-acetylglucosaminyl deacetylase